MLKVGISVFIEPFLFLQALQSKSAAAAEQERWSQMEIVGKQSNNSKESFGAIFCKACWFIMTDISSPLQISASFICLEFEHPPPNCV